MLADEILQGSSTEQVAVDQNRYPYVRNLAGVVLSVLDGDLAAILGRVSDHDHDSMHWLVRAATMLDAKGSEPSLLDFIRRAPDSSCRHYCEMALRGAGAT